MVEEDERLNKVKIAKTKKIRQDANDMAQKELCVCVCIVCGFRLFIDFISQV